MFLTNCTTVALCGWAAKSDDSFVCFGAKPPEQRGEAAWDRVQRQRVKMSLIPVALWNFR